MASNTAIPTSTSVLESSIIRAPLANVWHHIKLHDFANFWSALKSSDLVKGVSSEADVARWTFKDGTVLDVKQEEHSVSGVHLGRSQAHYQMLICPSFTRPSTITLPTALSRLSLSCPTPLLSALSDAMLSPLGN